MGSAFRWVQKLMQRMNRNPLWITSLSRGLGTLLPPKAIPQQWLLYTPVGERQKKASDRVKQPKNFTAWNLTRAEKLGRFISITSRNSNWIRNSIEKVEKAFEKAPAAGTKHLVPPQQHRASSFAVLGAEQLPGFTPDLQELGHFFGCPSLERI